MREGNSSKYAQIPPRYKKYHRAEALEKNAMAVRSDGSNAIRITFSIRRAFLASFACRRN